jgi:hypothetical protein
MIGMGSHAFSPGHARRKEDPVSPRRSSRPVVEALEGRALLSLAHSPSNPVPIGPHPISPSPQQLGAAYQHVVAIQAGTNQAIGADHRRLYAAYDALAARANHAVAQDRVVLQQGMELRAGEEQGLVRARGVADLTAYTDKIYIPNGLYVTLKELVAEARTTGANIARSAGRSTDAAIHELDALGARLAGTTTTRR